MKAMYKSLSSGGKIVKMYAEGGEVPSEADGDPQPKFVVDQGELKMVLGSGKMTANFTPSQLESYLKKSGFLKADYGGSTPHTEAKRSSIGKYTVADAVSAYNDSKDLSSISNLIDVNALGYETVIPGLSFPDRNPGKEVVLPIGKNESNYNDDPAQRIGLKYR